MAQSKAQSLVEVLVSTAIGYIVAVSTQTLIFPFFGIQVSLKDNIYMGIIFTVVSIIRSFLIRRLFNKIHGVKPKDLKIKGAKCGCNKKNKKTDEKTCYEKERKYA